MQGSVRTAGYTASVLATDVTHIEAARAQIAQSPAYDLFVNNAGTNRAKPLTDVTLEDYVAVRVRACALRSLQRRLSSLWLLEECSN